MYFFLTLLLMLPVASFTSPAAHPAAGAAIVPAILGTWQAGRVLAVNRNTHQMHVDHSPVDPDLSDNSLMPYGQRIRLGSGYDKAADVAYWLIEWLVPYPANALQFPFLQFQYTDVKGIKQIRQEPQSQEFTFEVDPAEYDFFVPVGATKTSNIYLLRCGANDEWVPEFYVSKDRQQMWCSIGLDDGRYYGLQEYHRISPLPAGKAPIAPKK